MIRRVKREVGDDQKHERPEPVDVVEPGLRPIPQDEEHDPDELLYDGDHLDRRQPPPEPLAGLALCEPDHESPQPAHREQGDDDVPDELVDPTHAGRSYEAEGPS